MDPVDTGATPTVTLPRQTVHDICRALLGSIGDLAVLGAGWELPCGVLAALEGQINVLGRAIDDLLPAGDEVDLARSMHPSAWGRGTPSR